MTTTRREFVRTATLGGLALGLGGAPTALGMLQDSRPAKKLNILILGGTGFIGPHMVERVLERGHSVTLFNRGKSNPHLFPDLEKLVGDRDPKIDDGLNALKGRDWDAAIDTASYYPRITGASANLLADHIEHYVFISSISAYKDGSIHGITEDAEVGTIEDETIEDMSGGAYGPLKVLCENAASKAMGGRSTSIRPGFIVGPRDKAWNRFPMWVKRVASRKNIVAPGTANDPVQLIDARDLAAFAVLSIEKKLAGVFNAVGPKDRLTVGAMIEGIKEGCNTDPEIMWMPNEFIEKWSGIKKQEGEKFNQMHMVPCISPDGEAKGYATVSNAKAVAAGMTFRSVADSARDSLKWIKEGQDAKRTASMQEYLGSGNEDSLLKAWGEREK